MILLIDNYDSFTHNLYHQLEKFEQVAIYRNDQITIEQIKQLNPKAIVISPGPGTPAEAGICIEVIQKLHTVYPILGVCLGHQAIGEAFGGSVIRAAQIMHGKTSYLHYDASGLFEKVTGDFEVMRYHSLIIAPETCPPELIVTATSEGDEEIMAIEHIDYPTFGVQFHPESIGTIRGEELIEQFLRKAHVLNR